MEGGNIHIEARSSGQQHGRLSSLAAELVAANVDVIVAQTGQAALAAKQATSQISIVMAASADAVAQGIIASLARPGGNVTGFTLTTPEYVPKRIELLREALPRATQVSVLWCPESLTTREELAAADAAARLFGLRVEPVEYRTRGSWDAIAATMARSRPHALFMLDCVNIPFEAVADFTLRCGIGFLGRPASESGRSCHGDGIPARGARRRRAFMLPTLILGPVRRPSHA